MLLRAAFLYGMLVFGVIGTGAAVWQTLELRVKANSLASSVQTADSLRRELQAATQSAQAAARRASIAEKDLESLKLTIPSDVASLDALRTELAAARQQLTAAETAMTEAESQLSSEITAHSALKAKTAELTQSLVNAERKISAQQPAGSGSNSVANSSNEPLVTGSVSKPTAEEPAKKAITIERIPEKKVQAKPVVKRPAKTAKHPEPSSVFSPFFQ